MPDRVLYYRISYYWFCVYKKKITEGDYIRSASEACYGVGSEEQLLAVLLLVCWFRLVRGGAEEPRYLNLEIGIFE